MRSCRATAHTIENQAPSENAMPLDATRDACPACGTTRRAREQAAWTPRARELAHGRPAQDVESGASSNDTVELDVISV